eukprot:15109663-Alexandrium_andersonii.AAC.1
MSASLVGSEMCIRDRHSAASCQRELSSQPMAEQVKRDRQSGVPKTTSETVSYTHLTLPTICSV